VDAALHLGTLAALVAYFRGELLGLATGSVSRRLGVLVIVATIPAGLAALAFGKYVETSLRSPLLIACTTAFWGLVMFAADRHAGRTVRAEGPVRGRLDDPLERVTFGQGLAVGFAQMLALIPGTSRSGITITTGLFAGLDRATAARYSFMLGIPITAAAGLKKSLDLARGGLPSGEGGPLLAAILVSFVSGWLAVWFLVSYLKRRSLTPFVIYRLALAALIVAVWYR
jgi:undecaprenyl-diphosphatase